MHVAFFIDHLGSGGAQRQVSELAAALHVCERLRVDVLTYHAADFFRPRLDEAGIPVTRFPKRGRVDPSLPVRLRRWLRAERPDVLHAFQLAPGLWSLPAARALPRRLRPALVAAERTARIAESPVRRALQTLLYRSCDAVTANAEPVARAIRERLRVPPERVHYIPNGIALASWDRAAEAPCPLPMDAGVFNLAVVGRLEAVKNHALVLDALARLPEAERRGVRVWFVGAASGGSAFAEAIRGRIRALGLEAIVEIVPPVRAIGALLRTLDGVILPSRLEGFPNVVLEAMASRTPCVAARVGDVPNMLEDGRTGLLFEPGSAGALAKALERLRALPPERRRHMGAAAREAVEARYRIECVAEVYEALYRRLAAAWEPSPSRAP